MRTGTRGWVVALIIALGACSSDGEKATTPGPTTSQSDAGTTESGADADVPAPSCDPYEERTGATELVIGPTGLETAIVGAIDAAKTSIEVMAYEIGYKPIAAALSKAKARGVALRIIVDRSQSSAQTDFAESLKQSPTHFPKSGARFFVFDAARAFVTSADMTELAMTKERNYGATIADPDDVAGLRALFEQDWKGENAPAPCRRLVVSPGSAHDLIVEHIESAEERLDLEVMLIQDPRVLEAIKGRTNKGFPVRVLLAGPEYQKGNDATGDALKAAGVEVRYFRNPDVHAKLVHTERGAVIGSHELATDVLDKERAVSLVVSGDTQQKILTQFDADWSTAALR